MMLHLILASVLAIQQPGDSGFFKRGDGTLALMVVGGTAAVAVFDERIARWTRQSRVQGDSGRYNSIKKVTVVNEMPLTVAAIATWGVGRLAGQRTVADVGWHLTESLLITEAVAEGMRIAIGRVRPRASQDDAFVFGPGKGLTRFENRAFPSLHAAVAFTTAAALVEEIRIRKPTAMPYAAPLLYIGAMVPGLTRLYLDQHWASDVFAGTFLGVYIGQRVVRHAHGHHTRIDRFMLGAFLLPRDEGVTLGWAGAY
jgi:PAP2 superfamily protein